MCVCVSVFVSVCVCCVGVGVGGFVCVCVRVSGMVAGLPLQSSLLPLTYDTIHATSTPSYARDYYSLLSACDWYSLLFFM